MSDTTSTKKVVVPREDPVLRAERLLAEAKAKAATTAQKRLDDSTAALGRANNQILRWTEIAKREQSNVDKAKRDLGIEAAPTAEEAEEIAAAGE